LQPSFLPVLAAFTGYLTWKWLARGHAGALRFAAIAALLMSLTLLPWLARNYLALGDVTFVRNNLPLELYLSNNDGASALHWVNQSGIANELHPFANPARAARVWEMGELAFQREMGRKFLSCVSSNPGAFARLTLLRICYFWIPQVRPAYSTLTRRTLTFVSRTGILGVLELVIVLLAFLGLRRMRASGSAVSAALL
jgi:hypothetical protein